MKSRRRIAENASAEKKADKQPRANATGEQPSPWNRLRMLAACLFLLVAVQLVFGQTVHFDFVGYDDDDYIRNNVSVTGGLSGEGIRLAFTQRRAGNWHPLTWISLMLDGSIFGSNPAGYHLTNMALHAATVILFFLILVHATGRYWASLFAATLFAIHPLRAESVAWAAERKDVLCGFFFMATIALYFRYIKTPKHRIIWYLAVLLGCALALMSKPMAVTLPFVLLLLDYWPLRRVEWGVGSGEWGMAKSSSPRPLAGEGQVVRAAGLMRDFLRPSSLAPRLNSLRLLLEKLPMFALVVGACVATMWAQQDSITSNEHLWFVYRFENAAIAYVVYVAKMFWPAALILDYPYPDAPWPLWQVILAAIALVAATAAAIVVRRRAPYAFVGWFWYIGMMIPVVGIVQVGAQSMADRYTYLPQIGLAIIVAWAAADACQRRPAIRWPCVAAAGVVVTALIALAHRQVGYWTNAETLWTHAAQCRPDHRLAQNNLFRITSDRGDVVAAKEHCLTALRFHPDDPDVTANLAFLEANTGDVNAAITHLHRALTLDPANANANNSMATVLASQNKLAEAEIYCRRAIQAKPTLAAAQGNLGNILSQEGRLKEAIPCYEAAIRLNPNDAAVYGNFAMTLLQLGRLNEAVVKYREAVRCNPDDIAAQRNLAWLLATCDDASIRNGREAVEIAERINQLTGGQRADILSALAAAYAEAGRFRDAVATAAAALKLADAQHLSHSAAALRAQIAIYESGKPYRQPMAKP